MRNTQQRNPEITNEKEERETKHEIKKHATVKKKKKKTVVVVTEEAKRARIILCLWNE